MSKLPQVQEKIVQGLARLEGKEADELRIALVSPPHRNSVLVVQALKQIGQRKLKLPAERLTELCHHYRASVRQEARRLNQQLKGADPGAFDPGKTMRSGPVHDLMDAIGSLLVEPAPVDVKWGAVTTTQFEGGKKTREEITHGWLLNGEGDRLVVLTPFGRKRTFAKETGDRQKSSASSTYRVGKIDEEVERLVKIRQKDNADFQLSERGGLTGQFEGRGASLYEALVGEWLYRAKRYDLSARVILPALDTLCTPTNTSYPWSAGDLASFTPTRCWYPLSATAITSKRPSWPSCSAIGFRGRNFTPKRFSWLGNCPDEATTSRH